MSLETPLPGASRVVNSRWRRYCAFLGIAKMHLYPRTNGCFSEVKSSLRRLVTKMPFCARLYVRQLAKRSFRIIILLSFVYLIYLLIHGLNYPISFNIEDTVIEESRCIQPEMRFGKDDWQSLLSTNVVTGECVRENDWTFIRKGRIWFSEVATKTHGSFSCDVTEISRDNDYFNSEGRRINNVANGQRIPFPVVRVFCRAASGSVFEKVFLVIVSGMVGANGTSMDRPNVVIFGFDSISRFTWRKLLPKTREFFTTVLGGVDLEGYGVLGDGTPPAHLGILTGHLEEELPEARKSMPKSSYVDVFPWIWNEFKNRGYLTQYAEDYPEIATFNMRMKGFQNKPVDFYYRPYVIEAEKDKDNFCYGSKRIIAVNTDFVYDFYASYPNTPKFSFVFFVGFTHDSYHLGHVDKEVRRFLGQMQDEGHLENTVFIFMSDHGSRFSSTRQTVFGKVDERSPYLSIRFPESYRLNKRAEMKNLSVNARRLTSPFDIHATLQHILTHENATSKGARGISLLSKISPNRTCAEAGIKEHWCVCSEGVPLDLKSDLASRASKASVEFINSLLVDVVHLCHPVKLDAIVKATKHELNKDMLRFKGSLDRDGRFADLSDNMSQNLYTIQLDIVTNPHMAKYFVTLHYDVAQNKFIFDRTQFSRANKYGDDPACVVTTRPDLMSYCVCR